MALNLVNSKGIMTTYEAVLNDELNWCVSLLFFICTTDLDILRYRLLLYYPGNTVRIMIS